MSCVVSCPAILEEEEEEEEERKQREPGNNVDIGVNIIDPTDSQVFQKFSSQTMNNSDNLQ